MTLEEFILYLTPCIIQVFISWIDLKHNPKPIERRLRFIGLLAFLALTFGMLMIIGAIGKVHYLSEQKFFQLARYGLGSGSILWIASQIIWISTRIQIVED